MNAESAGNVTKRANRAGRILTGIVMLVLLGSSAAKIAGVPRMVDGLIRAGIPPAAIVPIAILELSCLILYLSRRTTALGALLLTGFLGGAVVTHIIGGETFLPPLMIGLIVWAGAWFRIPEIREFVPFRKNQTRLGYGKREHNELRSAARG